MQIQIEGGPSVLRQASAAGYASVEHYVQSLLDRDRERLAIKEGIDAVNESRVQDFDVFDRDFRERNGIARDG